MGTKNTFSDLLFAQPSVFEGLGRVLDFGDTLTEYNEALSPAQADTLAVASDWRAVGADIANAIEAFNPESLDSTANQ